MAITAVVSNGNLLIELEDGRVVNAGRVQGPAGQEGQRGFEGPRGADGRDGRDGADGSRIHTGIGEPTAALGTNGDLYIDVQSTSLALFQKINNDWARIGSLKGLPGPQGPSGNASTQDWGAIVKPDAPPTQDNSGEQIELGDIWFDTTTGYIYINTANGWIPISDKPPATVSATPPEYNPSSDVNDPFKRYPVTVGDLWFDSEQLALYTAVEDAQGDLTWIIATPADRTAVLDEIPGTFVLPAAATDKTVATNDVTGVRYIYNEPKNQWIDISNQCWREDLVYTSTQGAGGDFYKELNTYVFNTPKTWTFSKFITKIGDTIYINAKPYVVTSYTEIPVDGQTTGMAVELDPDPGSGLYNNETYNVSNCPLELDRQLNRDLVSQLRGQFEFDADGKAILPDEIITETNNIFYQLPGLWWAGPAVQTNPNWKPSEITHLMVSQGRSAEETDDQGNMVWIDGTIAPSFEVGDIIHVNGRHIHADKRVWDLKYFEGFGNLVDNVWRVTAKIDIVNPNNVNIHNLNDVACYAVQKCVPDEQYAKNIWWGDEDDYEIFAPISISPWYEPEAFLKGNPDLLMQLRGYFEMDATNTYAILPDNIIEDYYDAQTGDELEYGRAGVWWIDPSFDTSNDARYRPLTLTYLLINGGRYIEAWDENTQTYIYDDAGLAPEFWPGDYIHISARGIDIYRPEDDPNDREAWGQRFDDVWRVVERYEVKDDNNVAPGWRFGDSLWAYKVEKAVRDHAYTQREWTIYENDDEASRVPCTVNHWHDINDIQFHVYGGEERYDPEVLGRSEAEVANWDGDNGVLVDATVKKTFFNPTQNYVAFNKDLIPSGTASWSSRLSPYPQHLFLKFDNGEKINFVVEFIARGGQNNRSYNFRILDRGNLPLGDLSSIDGVEFEIYRDWSASRDGLQTQIDNLLDFSQYEELP